MLHQTWKGQQGDTTPKSDQQCTFVNNFSLFSPSLLEILHFYLHISKKSSNFAPLFVLL